MHLYRTALEVLAAIGLDLLIGDPEWFPHPVRIMGHYARDLARELRPRVINQKTAGILVTAIIVLGTFIVVWLGVQVVEQINSLLGTIIRIFLIYTAVSIRDLSREALMVQRKLLKDTLPAARQQVARIVGRDTLDLTRTQVAQAAVESVAESTVDGIISPLFYAFLGGAPLALAFKAASTLDSMFGYRTPGLREFGWASAKLDDVANFIPARLSIFAITVGSFVRGRRWMRAFTIAIRDRRKHLSPNAGIPEAAFAGALGVSLGGPSTYGGSLVNRPWLGDALREVRIEDISEACMISIASALAFALPVAALMVVIPLWR